MANKFENLPVLSKVKIEGQYYWLKDADARQYAEDIANSVDNEAALRLAADNAINSAVDAHDVRIRNLEARGRYLSTWDASTGLPGDYPTIPASETGLEYTYTFKAGDYYIVGNVPSTGKKYMPDGASITATRTDTSSSWVWSVGKKETTDSISKGDQYVYSTTSWTHIAAAKDVAWGNITGNLVDQEDLNAALAAKADNSALKELAFKNKADVVAEVVSKTVSGVRATGDLSGTISATIQYDSTDIASTGKFTPAGSVSVELNNNTIQSKKTDGVVPSFTEGTFTPNVPTVINTAKFNGGAVATWTGAEYTAPSFTEGDFCAATYEHTGFSGGSLGEATKSQFAIEGLVVEVNNAAECLVFTAASKSDAVTAQGTFTAAEYGNDVFFGGSKAKDTWNAGSHSFGTFNGGTVASLGDGFYTAGTAASKASDTFNGGSMPVFEEKVVGVASSTFNGSEGNLSVSGQYDKAKSELSGSAAINGANLAVGDIVVPAQNAAIKDI